MIRLATNPGMKMIRGRVVLAATQAQSAVIGLGRGQHWRFNPLVRPKAPQAPGLPLQAAP